MWDIQNLFETNDVSCNQYADGIKIDKQIENGKDMELLQLAKGRLAHWADEWQLQLSHAETFHLRLVCSEPSSAYSRGLFGMPYGVIWDAYHESGICFWKCFITSPSCS